MSDVARKVTPLPATVQDMLNNRRTAAGRTLNDYVEDLHIKAYADPKYQAFLEAVYDAEAVEGSLSADNHEAGRYLRELAVRENVPQVAGRKIAVIVKSLNVVLRRYRMTRKERAMTIGGYVMRDHNNDE